MIKRKLDRKNHKEIYEYVEGICKDMGIQRDIGIKVMKGRDMTGEVNSKKYIELTNPLINIYCSKPFVVKLVIAHELAHMKHKDNGIERAWWSLATTKKSCAKILLQESRADIEGAYYSKLTKEEIHEAHMILKEYNDKFYKHTEYKGGYASRNKRSYYSQKYSEFSYEAIEEIITGFCTAKNIKDIKSFMELAKRFCDK